MREIKKNLGSVAVLVQSYTETQNSCLSNPKAPLASVTLCLAPLSGSLYSIPLSEIIFAYCKYFNQNSNINAYSNMS